MNTHLVWGPAPNPRSPDHLVNARPDWLGVPRALAEELFTLAPNDPRYVDALRRYADRNRGTVEGIYTSPSHPEVQARVHQVWMELLDRYDRFYVPGRRPRYLRRNLLVVLGNVGSIDDVEVVAKHRDHPDEIVSEHARWAFERMVERGVAQSEGTPSGK